MGIRIELDPFHKVTYEANAPPPHLFRLWKGDLIYAKSTALITDPNGATLTVTVIGQRQDHGAVGIVVVSVTHGVYKSFLQT